MQTLNPPKETNIEEEFMQELEELVTRPTFTHYLIRHPKEHMDYVELLRDLRRMMRFFA